MNLIGEDLACDIIFYNLNDVLPPTEEERKSEQFLERQRIIKEAGIKKQEIRDKRELLKSSSA